jgi:hypothetical protein
MHTSTHLFKTNIMLSDEWNLILGKLSTDGNELINLVANGQYCEIIAKYPQFYESSPLESLPSGKDTDMLALGVAGLNSFCQLGWTGPKLESNVDLQTKPYLDELTCDGEVAYALTPGPLLLLRAKQLFRMAQCKSAKWWLLRSLFIHQRLLENPSATLYAEMLVILDEFTPEQDQELLVRWFVEKGLILSFHHHDRDGAACFQQAADASGLQWQFSGAMGKRTRFQQNSVAQLIVQAKSSTEEPATDGVDDLNVKLSDDVLYDSIKFDDESNKSNLKPLDQSILLALCMHVKKTSPVDGLTVEKMASFVNRVLENANNWMIHTQSLLLRSRFESNKARTVERSALQLQALVDQYALTDSTVQERMLYFYSLMLPAKWEMEVINFECAAGIPMAIEFHFNQCLDFQGAFCSLSRIVRKSCCYINCGFIVRRKLASLQPNPCVVSKLRNILFPRETNSR